MKNISTELKQHIAGELTSLATCWRIARVDNVVMGFTSHDKDIVFQSVTYKASSGFTPASVTSDSDLGADKMQLEGFLDSANLSEIDLLAGKYDFAEIEIFQVNYEDLTQGKITYRTGWFGEVTSSNNQFSVEISGLMQRLSKTIGSLYSPSCRAKLGDSKCAVAMMAYTVTGSVTGVTDNRVFADSSRIESNGYFNFGKITFTSGNNNGLSMEVKEYATGSLELVLPLPYMVQIGDNYSMEAGCDKSLVTCKERFSNLINFRAEPFVPGTDEILKTSSS